MISIGALTRYLVWWGLMLIGSWFLYRTAVHLGLEWGGGSSNRALESLLGLMAGLIVFSDRRRRPRVRRVKDMIDRFARGPTRRYLRRRFREHLSSPPGIRRTGRRLRDQADPGQRRYFFRLLLSLAFVGGTLTDRERGFFRELGEAMEVPPDVLDRWIRSARSRRTGPGRGQSGRKRGSSKEHTPGSGRREASEVLGVSPDASEDAIRRAYQEKVKEHHPDQYRSDGDETRQWAEETMARINRAYRILQESKSVG